MIAKEIVEDLINKKVIKISYTFYEDENHNIVELPQEIFVDPTNKDSMAYKIFDKNFKGDRLSITMGAIVFSHNFKRFRNRINFNNKDNYFDLRQTNNKIIIQPGETISVPSNERLSINDNLELNKKINEYYGAIILPRLTIADAGLFYVPSYIDPAWDGVMQALLYNFSKSPIEIKIGEALSVCKFYKITGKVDNHFQESFQRQNHHFAQNWKNILDGSKEPIRRGKEPINISLLRKIFSWQYVKPIIKDKSHLILVGSLLTFLISSIFVVKYAFIDYPNTKEKVNMMEQNLNSMPVSKEFEYRLNTGIKIFNFNEEIERPKSYKTIWLQANNEDIPIKSISYTKNSENIDKIRISFNVELFDLLKENKSLKIKLMFVD